jgi:hypothetical protein
MRVTAIAMKNTIMLNWFLDNSWGWRRYLADCAINTIHTPLRTIWWSVFGGVGIVLGVKFSQITGVPRWLCTVFSVFGVFLMLWLVNLFWIVLLRPLPPCRNGCCKKTTDYMWAWGFVFGKEGRRKYRYWCKCGDQYILQGSTFYYVATHGDSQPYMKRVGFRRWKQMREDDKSEQNSCQG